MNDVRDASNHQLLYIDGAWVHSASPDMIPVIDPTSELEIARVPGGSAVDVDSAVEAARKALSSWAATTPAARADLLSALADALEARQGEIAAAIVSDVGTPIRMAQRIQAALPINDIRTMVGLLRAGALDDETVGNSTIVREAAGVVGAITPWNYPLHQTTCKLAPALAAGCTVVLKPSEVAPLSIYLLFDAIHEVGFPAGVVNLVSGSGAVVGHRLVEHPEVDVVSFTGSVESGARVAETAARTIKRVTLELGGKSANVILDDADLETAVKVGVSNAFLNGGQTCTAWTRMLVPSERLDEAASLAKKYAEGFTVGDPAESSTKLGPMVSEQQRERVRGFISAGIAEGATLVTGGLDRPVGAESGWFVAPTVFSDVDPDSTLAQEEIFGPVLSIIGYADEDDALAIANNSRYGLHGSVWSANQERALRFARGVRTGQIDVNGGAFNPLAPFGGYKQSGVGRELGRQGLEEFLEVKAIQQ